MKPTMKLRWLVRPNPLGYSRVLQQWWEGGDIYNILEDKFGEWRDIGVVND